MTTCAFPRLALVEQSFDATEVTDMRASVRAELAGLGLEARVRPGQSVAVTAGSRGIANIAAILAETCSFFRGLGAEPFIVPAMGSHGGATAEGQTALLRDKGITEESVGAPIRSSMNTVLLGETPSGIPVHADALAAASDHIVAVNRVKAHTKFKGRIESGLMKMLSVGLGKHAGALVVHRLGVSVGFERAIVEPARLMLDRLPVLAGLGIVENGYGRTHTIRAVRGEELEDGEARLLLLAKELSPKLPAEDVDLLVVDLIGKDLSGTGMDTNVTGRNRDIVGDFTTTPRIKRIFVRDLSPGSGGNANGIGFADFTTSRLVAATDWKKTYTNALTAISPEKAAIPVHFPTDREALAAALDSLGAWSPVACRVVRIESTLSLHRLLVSEALLPRLPARCRVVRPPKEPGFDCAGNLLPLACGHPPVL